MNISKTQKITGLTTALLLTLFLITHAVLCLTVLSSDPTFFNHISNLAATSPMVIVGHIILDLLLLSHIIVTIIFTIKKQKMEKRADNKAMKKHSTIMIITGILVLIYVFIHFFSFISYDAASIGLYEYIHTLFSSATVVIINVFFIAILFIHLYIAGRTLMETCDIPIEVSAKVILFHKIVSIALFIAYAMVPLWIFFHL